MEKPFTQVENYDTFFAQAMHETLENKAENEVAKTLSELEEERWAVISFDRVEGLGLTFADAEALLAKLAAEGIAGLCIVTSAAASRVS